MKSFSELNTLTQTLLLLPAITFSSVFIFHFSQIFSRWAGCSFQAVRVDDMNAASLKIPLLTISALTTQDNKRNGVFQNEERDGICNADSLWLLCLHGNILLPQSHRGLRRYSFISYFFFFLLSWLPFRSGASAEEDICLNYSIKAPPFNRSSPLSTYSLFKESSKKALP